MYQPDQEQQKPECRPSFAPWGWRSLVGAGYSAGPNVWSTGGELGPKNQLPRAFFGCLVSLSALTRASQTLKERMTLSSALQWGVLRLSPLVWDIVCTSEEAPWTHRHQLSAALQEDQTQEIALNAYFACVSESVHVFVCSHVFVYICISVCACVYGSVCKGMKVGVSAFVCMGVSLCVCAVCMCL